WRAAGAADPQNRAARYQLGQALVGLGRRAEAGPYLAEAEAIRRRTEDLKRAVNDRLGGGPDGGAEACEALGRLCQAAGLGAEGRAWFEEAIRIEPTRGSSQSALARAGAGPAPSPVAPRLRRPAPPPPPPPPPPLPPPPT